MRKITQTIVGTTPPLDKNVIWLDSTDNTAPVEKVFINGQWTPMGIDTDDYYTKEEVNGKLEEKLDVIETPVNGNLIAMDSQGQAIDSGKKTTDFIANPASEGQEGEVLSVDSEGNPVWTTVTPTGTADTEMSDTSTNAVQNKVIKSYVDDNYARKDGYYSTLTAGAAENLVGQTVDSEAYLIRPTGGAENEVANGVASVLGMEGNSCVWNQLFNRPVSSFSFTRASYSDNRLTATGTTGKAFTSFNVTQGHVYLLSFYGSVSPNGGAVYFGFYDGSANNYINIQNATTPGLYGVLITATDVNSVGFYLKNAGAYIDIDLTKIMVIDLTVIFGAGNEPSTVAEFRTWLAQHVGTKPYYAYNAGTILSAQTLGIKTYGQNLLNPTTRQAKLIPYTWVENGITYSNQYTIKNVPSGATATFTPDNTGVAESVTITDNIFDITSYGSGILELSAATADTYVCIKWNGTEDNDVVPYEDHTYDFDVTKVYGKVNGEGNYEQCFPNGMRGFNTYMDFLDANRAERNISSYTVDENTTVVRKPKLADGIIQCYVFEITLPNTPKKNFTDTQVQNNAITTLSKYSFVSRNTIKDIDNAIIVGLNSIGGASAGPHVYIRDDSYTTATEFKSSIIGATFEYLIPTITYTDLIYRDEGIDRPLADILMNITVNNWSMEEQLMTPYDNGNPTSIPATIKTQYGMDAVEAIDTLQKTCYFADDVRANLQALLTCINTNCSETLGGTFAISETATDKVFAFAFTPNTEPDVEPTNEVGE